MATDPTISDLIAVSRRQAKIFSICCAAGVALGLGYLLVATPLYSATASVQINPRRLNVLRNATDIPDAPVLDPAVVESHAEVLQSDQVGLSVVRALNLTENPAYTQKSFFSGFFSKLKKAETGGADIDEALKKELAALDVLNTRLRVFRVPKTFIIKVEYTAPDPLFAAKVANAFTDAYVNEEAKSHGGLMDQARQWLETRAEELRKLSAQADHDVQKFRAENNLLSTKGVFVSEQRFEAMNTQVVAQQTAAAQARARYENIKRIIDTSQQDWDVIESLTDPVLNDLRMKYLATLKRKTELQAKVGPGHATIRELNVAMEELKRLIFHELSRIAATYKSDFEVAEAREKALAEELNRNRATVVGTSQAQVQLRQLEQKADAYRTLYQNYMVRYQEAQRESGAIIPDNIVVVPAQPPRVKTSPLTGRVLLMSLALGALTGVGAGAFREMRDRGFRTRQQVRQELDLRVLAMLPQLPSVAARASHMDPMFRHSIENPLSLFTEGLRFVKSSADRALKYQRPKVIGVISMLPNEGKTTVSKNLASLLANEGDGCLLIDADTRLQKLTLGLKDDTVNLIDVPERKGSNYLLKKELNSNLLILLQERDGRGAEKEFDFAIAEPLMRQSGQSFEYAVVDFPPLGPVVGARNTANWIDAFVLVIEWGVTSRNALRMLIDNEPEMKRKLLGVILNKTNMDDLKNYVDPDSEDYYHSTYNRYLSDDVRPAA